MSLLKELDVSREAFEVNGVPVILYRRKGPLSVRLAFLSGSVYDPQDRGGLAHFTEHMLVAGTEKFPSKDKMAEYIEKIGGVFGAMTGFEHMYLDFQVAESGDFPVAVEIADQMLNHSLFSDKLIETERGSILQEIDVYDSDPRQTCSRNFYSLMHRGTEYEHRIIGTKEEVEATTAGDLKDFFGKKLAPERLTIIASGDIEPDVMRRQLHALKLKDAPRFNPSKDLLAALSDRKVVCAPFDVNDQIHLNVGFPVEGFHSEDEPALSLIGTIMGGGRASVLSRLLRYEKGLVYTVHAGPYFMSRGGVWYINTSCAKEKLEEVMQVIEAECQRIFEGGVTEEELEFAKSKRVKSIKIGLQTSGSWVSAHSADEVFRTGETVDDRIKAINSVSMEDLARVGKKYFSAGAMKGSFAGRITEKEVNLP